MPERKKAQEKRPKAKPRPRVVKKRAVVEPPKPVSTESDSTSSKPTRKAYTGKLTYVFAVGRRKSAIARVRYYDKGNRGFSVNGRAANEYFPTFELRKIVHDPQELTQYDLSGDVSVKVHGGGIRGQAEAVRLGISRFLVRLQPDLRTPLKRAGFLTRDPRVKERKKYGLKRARRAPQWQKR